MSDQDGGVPADLARLMQLVVTRHVWGKGLTAEQMRDRLASALDKDRAHLVSVRTLVSGRLEVEFDAQLGDVGRAFEEASKAAFRSKLS
ncbi:hypothetical protein ACVWWK_003358 [Bradyrhizobium sp. LB9.1b]